MNVVVILVAAGSGVRLGAAMPKAFAPLCGESLLAHALRGILCCGQVGHIVVVAPASHIDQCAAIVGQSCPDTDHARVDTGHGRQVAEDPRVDVVSGGGDRSASVQAGLAALSIDDGIVLVHDVARCLAPADLFDRVIAAVRHGHQAVVPGLALTDTVKVVDAHGRVLQTPERGSLRAIQTPQGFLRETLERGHASGASATDDAGLVERIGGHVHVVAGDHRAMKITTPADLTIATAVLQDGLYAG